MSPPPCDRSLATRSVSSGAAGVRSRARDRWRLFFSTVPDPAWRSQVSARGHLTIGSKLHGKGERSGLTTADLDRTAAFRFLAWPWPCRVWGISCPVAGAPAWSGVGQIAGLAAPGLD